MPQRLTPAELAVAIAESVYGDVPDVSDSLEPDDSDSLGMSFRLLP
ncbi:hypothetical protein LBMAG42_24810 [Deltaproteobacteria bacterium]|nr:hypothetical protein LBMAG42_24810 [Deltaproteobacteria bacterium]